MRFIAGTFPKDIHHHLKAFCFRFFRSWENRLEIYSNAALQWQMSVL
jgi:hypothetical protein